MFKFTTHLFFKTNNSKISIFQQKMNNNKGIQLFHYVNIHIIVIFCH